MREALTGSPYTPTAKARGLLRARRVNRSPCYARASVFWAQRVHTVFYFAILATNSS